MLILAVMMILLGVCVVFERAFPGAHSFAFVQSKTAIRLTWAFPLLVLLFLYLTWFAGGRVLGRAPRPMIDDPATALGGWGWVYDATVLLISWGTPFFLLGIVTIAAYVLVQRTPDWKRKVIELCVSLVLFAALIGFVIWDPHHVVHWLLD